MKILLQSSQWILLIPFHWTNQVHLYESEEDISNNQLPTWDVPFDDSAASLEKKKEKDRGR